MDRPHRRFRVFIDLDFDESPDTAWDPVRWAGIFALTPEYVRDRVRSAIRLDIEDTECEVVKAIEVKT